MIWLIGLCYYGVLVWFWLLDYSVGQFFEDARQATTDIFKNGHVPIVAGGTGLYLRWYLCLFSFKMRVIQLEDMLVQLFGSTCSLHLMGMESNPIEIGLVASKSIHRYRDLNSSDKFRIWSRSIWYWLDIIGLSHMLSQESIISWKIESTKHLKNEKWAWKTYFFIEEEFRDSRCSNQNVYWTIVRKPGLDKLFT